MMAKLYSSCPALFRICSIKTKSVADTLGKRKKGLPLPFRKQCEKQKSTLVVKKKEKKKDSVVMTRMKLQ